MQETLGPEIVKQALNELNPDEDNSYASKLCRHMLTTGMNFEGYKIKEYKGSEHPSCSKQLRKPQTKKKPKKNQKKNQKRNYKHT